MARTPLLPVKNTQVDPHRSSISAPRKKQMVRNEKRKNFEDPSPQQEDTKLAKAGRNNTRSFQPLVRRNSSILSSKSSSTASTATSTSTGCTASSHSQRHSQRIRSQYFYKLGVIPSPASESAIHTKDPPTELLKRDLGQTDLYLHTTPNLPLHVSSSSSNRDNNNNSKLRFSTRVQVHIIPSHVDLEQQGIKSDIWSSPEQLEEMAYRNCIEFATEQWDWRLAIEEHEFVPMVMMTGPDGSHGDVAWVHPAHYHRQFQQQEQQNRRSAYNPFRSFSMILSAQQQQQQQQQCGDPYYYVQSTQPPPQISY